MIVTLPSGEKRELDDTAFSTFVTEHGKPLVPKPADYYAQALAPLTKDEYTRLCGPNNFIEVYIIEINRVMAARLSALTKPPTPPSA